MVWGKSLLIAIELNMPCKQHILIAQYPKRKHSLTNKNGYNYMQWKVSFNIFLCLNVKFITCLYAVSEYQIMKSSLAFQINVLPNLWISLS